ncbi:hypothetical protein [Metabacillus sp. SLBN-84]
MNNKTRRLAFVKEKYGMSPTDVLRIAYYNLHFSVVMVGELTDEQWEAIIREVEGFSKDGLLASYLGHDKTEIRSGALSFRKLTKTQVRSVIRNSGWFHGYLCGNRVNPSHLADGWNLGMKIDTNDLKQFETMVDDFQTNLSINTPDLGQYPHFYEIVKGDERNDAKRETASV